MAAGGRNWPDDVRIGDVIVRRVPHPILGNPERVVTLVDSHRIEFKDGWMSRGSLRDYRLVRRAGEEGDEHGD